MTRQYEFIEGFRITRDTNSLLIEATDYHALPLRLYRNVLADLGVKLVEARDVARRPNRSSTCSAE
jgi:hypothetical protein